MTAGAPAELLDWDTRYWGYRVARVHELSESTASGLHDWAVKNAVDCFYLRLEPQPVTAIHLAEDIGFRVMDIRVDYARNLGDLAPHSDDPMVRAAVVDDVPRLEAIARSSHRGSRFYADTHFPHSRCDDFYAAWIANSFAGYADAVLVGQVDGKPAGYVTGHIEGDHGRIGLLAVEEGFAGRGLGSTLTQAMLTRFRAAGLTRAFVATQGSNLPARKLYERRGFRTDHLGLTFHWWPKHG